MPILLDYTGTPKIIKNQLFLRKNLLTFQLKILLRNEEGPDRVADAREVYFHHPKEVDLLHCKHLLPYRGNRPP